MNIELQKSGDLTATVRMDIEKADYEPGVTKVLKDLQRKANIPGFRPGKVPMGMIKKMYGQAVIAEEVNKLISEKLDSYIREQDLKLLGHPLANEEKTETVDLDADGPHSFYFDLGLAPEFEVNYTPEGGFVYYDIEASDKVVDDYIETLRKKHGSTEDVAAYEEGTYFSGSLKPVEETEEAESKYIDLWPESISDETFRERLKNAAINDELTFNPAEVIENVTDRVNIMDLKEDEADSTNRDYRLVIEQIRKEIPAEIGEEFFREVYPDGSVNSLDEMKTALKNEAASQLIGESDRKFSGDAMKKLIEGTRFDLPEDFMKRWLLETNTKLTEEEFEKEKATYLDALRWQLIENEIALKNDLQVTRDDIKNVYRSYFTAGRPGGMDEEMEKRIDSIAESMMSNEEEVRRISTQLMEKKVTDFIREKTSPEKVKITYEDFLKLN